MNSLVSLYKGLSISCYLCQGFRRKRRKEEKGWQKRGWRPFDPEIQTPGRHAKIKKKIKKLAKKKERWMEEREEKTWRCSVYEERKIESETDGQVCVGQAIDQSINKLIN